MASAKPGAVQFADGGYQGPKLQATLKELGVSDVIEIMEKPKDAREFTVPLPQMGG